MVNGGIYAYPLVPSVTKIIPHWFLYFTHKNGDYVIEKSNSGGVRYGIPYKGKQMYLVMEPRDKKH